MARAVNIRSSLPDDFKQEFFKLEAHSKHLRSRNYSHIDQAPQYFSLLGACTALSITTLSFIVSNKFSLSSLVTNMLCGAALGGSFGLATSNYLRGKLIEVNQNLNEKICALTRDKLDLNPSS